MMMTNPNISLFEFDKAVEVDRWRTVNDGVMGGLSQGNIQWNTVGHSLVWTGTVSLENNGGFASIRTAPKHFKTGIFDKIVLRVKGDGNTYKFRMRPSGNFDGIAYSLDFPTEKEEWKEIYLSIDDFQPTFRGRIYPEYGTLKTEDLQQVGFLIAGKQAGDFKLEVDWIRYEK